MLEDRHYLTKKNSSQGHLNSLSVSKKQLCSLIAQIEKYVLSPTEDTVLEAGPMEEPSQSSLAGNFKQLLLLKIMQFNKFPPQSKRRTLAEQFRRYLIGEELTTDLMRMKALLEKAQSSSAESERAFSAAGLFLSKVRSKLSDDSLNMLCFVKHRMLSKAG